MPRIVELEDIKNALDVQSLIEAIEEGFVLYSAGKVVVPPVGFLNFEEPRGDVHIKYGYVREDDVYVVKIASGFPGNACRGILPADGVILVFNQQTGHLRTILHDQCWLTDMRTAAAGAIAARHLAPHNVHAIGIVGTGVQARMQLELLSRVVDCNRCFVWGRDAEKVQSMLDELNNVASIRDRGMELTAAPSLEALCSNCNLIVTTTSARRPLLLASDVQPGTHITAMGSDDHGKQELDAALLGKADVVVADSIAQCVDHGECCHAVRENAIAQDDILELGAVIRDPDIGRTADDQISIADLTGIAIQDIQVAKIVCKAIGA